MSFAKVYNYFLVILIVFFFFSEAALYLYEKDLSPLSLVHWAIILLSFSIPLLIIDRSILPSILKSSLFSWLCLLCFVTFFWGCYEMGIASNFGEDGIEQINRNILACLYIFAFMIILHRIEAFWFAHRLIVLVVILSVGINIFDFISLDKEQFCPIYGRAAGFYYNPAICCTALTFGYIFSMMLLRDTLKFIFTIWVFIGIGLTQSRGGIAIFSIIVILFF